jgi:1-acyl-sn-glycerol-3-phosphate acyltransferase
MKLVYRIGHTGISLIGRFGFQLRVYGRENLIEDGPAIVASNHQSYLDPPLIGCVHRKELYYLGRDSLFRNPVFGAILRAVNVVPVDRERGDVGAIKTIIRVIKEGRRAIIFPEGTRSMDGKLQPAKAGLGMVVARTLAPVVPIRIFGSYAALPKTGRLKWCPVSIVVGRPIRFTKENISGGGREIYQQLSDQAMAAIARLELPLGR